MLRSHFPKLFTFPALVLIAFLAGCAPRVGDSCETSAECPSGAICDVTAPGGYCAIRDCDSESCPDGSVCVEFDHETFCLEYCEIDGDCRENDGYVCRTDNGPAGFCYVAN